jgi:hypothetical protein
MLFQLKIKLAKTYFLAVVFSLLINEASVAQTTNHDSCIHGFIAQGLINVDGSDFVNNDGDLSAELTEVGLNGSYQLNSLFRLTSQVVYLDGGNRYDEGFRVDYALLDWSLYQAETWEVNVYLGRFKNNHWLYSGKRDVPFTRPSIILPQSIYFDGFRDIAVGADGAVLKISHSSDLLGDFDFNVSSGTTPISKEQTQILYSEQALGKMSNSHDVQTSLYWQPANSSWRFGLALLDADFGYEAQEQGDRFFDTKMTFQRVMVNALFEGERWEFSSEVIQERFVFDGFYFPEFHHDKLGQGYYSQFRYKIDNSLILLARYERFYADKDNRKGDGLEEASGGLLPSYSGYQHDITLGVSYDLAEKFRLQFEYHNIEGIARLTPAVLPNLAINNSKRWDLWAIQLMYWF